MPGQVTIEPKEGDTVFMEDYVPFGMGEICGNFDGFDGDDAVAGLCVEKDQAVNEMEQKYASDGLYIWAATKWSKVFILSNTLPIYF